MCGIFGFVQSREADLDPGFLKEAARRLFILSETRGKEASGLAGCVDDQICVFKRDLTASRFVRLPQYAQSIDRISAPAKNGTEDRLKVFIGHSRLVTNGTQSLPQNNQPISSNGMVIVHNGIITNHESLWRDLPGQEHKTQVDSEVLLAILRKSLNKDQSLAGAVTEMFRRIEGCASIAVLFEDYNALFLGTNNGSLYFVQNEPGDFIIFASERFILEQFVGKLGWKKSFSVRAIRNISPGHGIIVDLEKFMRLAWNLKEDFNEKDSFLRQEKTRTVVELYPEPPRSLPSLGARPRSLDAEKILDAHAENSLKIDALRRCRRCILPETMPFIEFDDEGICSYCRNYVPIRLKGPEALEKSVAPFRRGGNEPDCLVAISGGRDSSYALHYLKKVLGMKPIAFTYDWGMVNDLARRNQSRMCGALGVEHILVSADISQKRDFIRKNVLAWLKRPHLGTIPLFMAGDKQYFYYANQLKKQTGQPLLIMGENLYEKTNFKTGFGGIKETGKGLAYGLAFINKMRMAFFYSMEFIRNPAYLNASFWDTVTAYFSYYFIDHHYVNLYDYVPWEEEKILQILVHDYQWETASDYQSTWRIGDGTAAFYNHIYYTVAGFTEHDTFRSNQIREGIMTREEALRHTREENRPRLEAIREYCDLIGVDAASALETIARIPKRYQWSS